MLDIYVKKTRGSFALDISLRLPTPGVVALFGPSGCGKTTLVNIVAGLLDADVGHGALDDTVLFDTERRICVRPERRRIGYVFQDARLFPHLRVVANLMFAARRATGRPYVSLDDAVSLLDLAGLMGRRTHQLSGGERQRVAIGRALLSQPRLLLLDEPLASLDRARRDEVLPYLEKLRDQVAIPMVYVSHQFEEVLRLATHIVVMRDGGVLAQGDMGEIGLDPRLRTIIGPDAVGAILDGVVLGRDDESGLTRVRVGNGELRVRTADLASGTSLRLQLLARDIVVSTQRPHSLSVRNNLQGIVKTITSEDAESDLIAIDIGIDVDSGANIGSGSGVGSTLIMARVTKAATRELSLRPGLPVWALLKSVSLRGHTFARAPPNRPII